MRKWIGLALIFLGLPLLSQATPVNSQITDAVTQANVKVLGDSPAMAMGTLYSTLTDQVTVWSAAAHDPAVQHCLLPTTGMMCRCLSQQLSSVDKPMAVVGIERKYCLGLE